jgi:predicted MFS family arabinose efflux permease
LTAYAMAISSTLCGALLVENGQKFGDSGRLVNQQWLWFNIATMAASLGGGALIQWLSPTSALHAAAFIIALAPLALIATTWPLIDEEKRSINLPQLKNTLRSLGEAFRRRELWIVAIFLFVYYFNPGLGTPLYYHMTDDLKFSQAYIGILAAISSAGWIVGSLLYQRFFDGLSSRTLLNASIALGTVSTASYLMLSGEVSAAALSFCAGFSAMLATVATLTLAADFSPRRSEGFAYAVLLSVTNLAAAVADNAGSFLYERAFDHSLAPLIIVSASFTAFAFVLVPMLRLGDKPQGQPVAAGG